MLCAAKKKYALRHVSEKRGVLSLVTKRTGVETETGAREPT